MVRASVAAMPAPSLISARQSDSVSPAVDGWVAASRFDRIVARRWWLFFALVALNVADIVTTQVGLERGAVERNPLMVGAVGSWSGAILAKTLCLGAAAAVLLSAPRRSRVLNVGVLACVCWYLGVVCWNLNVISSQS